MASEAFYDIVFSVDGEPDIGAIYKLDIGSTTAGKNTFKSYYLVDENNSGIPKKIIVHADESCTAEYVVKNGISNYTTKNIVIKSLKSRSQDLSQNTF